MSQEKDTRNILTVDTNVHHSSSAQPSAVLRVDRVGHVDHSHWQSSRQAYCSGAIHGEVVCK